MTHMEKYSENIAKIACSGELFGVIRGDDKPVSCRSAICQKCLFYTARPDPDDWCSRKSAASGLIPNANVQKTIRDRIYAVSLLCKSSH